MACSFHVLILVWMGYQNLPPPSRVKNFVWGVGRGGVWLVGAYEVEASETTPKPITYPRKSQFVPHTALIFQGGFFLKMTLTPPHFQSYRWPIRVDHGIKMQEILCGITFVQRVFSIKMNPNP